MYKERSEGQEERGIQALAEIAPGDDPLTGIALTN